jgi:hypothetical protein
MTSRERASTLVPAMFIVVAVWIGAFGCISFPYSYERGRYARVESSVREGVTLKKLQEVVPNITPAGHRVVDGVRIDAYVGDQPPFSDRVPDNLQKRWYYFHDDRLVLWSVDETWNLAASRVIEQRKQEEAEAARNAPMGDSW